MIRTEHEALIKAIVTHPDMYDHVCDDGAPLSGDYEPLIGDDIHYLLSDEGLVIYSPVNHCTWNAHVCILPKWRGKASGFMRESIKWMFDNTNCKKIEARVPSFNKAAYAQAKHVGFKDEGVSEKSYLKDGKLYDMNLLGVTWE